MLAILIILCNPNFSHSFQCITLTRLSRPRLYYLWASFSHPLIIWFTISIWVSHDLYKDERVFMFDPISSKCSFLYSINQSFCLPLQVWTPQPLSCFICARYFRQEYHVETVYCPCVILPSPLKLSLDVCVLVLSQTSNFHTV